MENAFHVAEEISRHLFVLFSFTSLFPYYLFLMSPPFLCCCLCHLYLVFFSSFPPCFVRPLPPGAVTHLACARLSDNIVAEG